MLLPKKQLIIRSVTMLWLNSPLEPSRGKIGYVGETDVRIDTSAQGYSWSNEVLNKQQFEDSLRRDKPTSDKSLDKLPISGSQRRMADIPGCRCLG